VRYEVDAREDEARVPLVVVVVVVVIIVIVIALIVNDVFVALLVVVSDVLMISLRIGKEEVGVWCVWNRSQ